MGGWGGGQRTGEVGGRAAWQGTRVGVVSERGVGRASEGGIPIVPISRVGKDG